MQVEELALTWCGLSALRTKFGEFEAQTNIAKYRRRLTQIVFVNYGRSGIFLEQCCISCNKSPVTFQDTLLRHFFDGGVVSHAHAHDPCGSQIYSSDCQIPTQMASTGHAFEAVARVVFCSRASRRLMKYKF